MHPSFSLCLILVKKNAAVNLIFDIFIIILCPFFSSLELFDQRCYYSAMKYKVRAHSLYSKLMIDFWFLQLLQPIYSFSFFMVDLFFNVMRLSIKFLDIFSCKGAHPNCPSKFFTCSI